MLLDKLIKARAEEKLLTSYNDEDEITNANNIINDLCNLIEYEEEEIGNILQDRDDNFRRLSIEEQI